MACGESRMTSLARFSAVLPSVTRSRSEKYSSSMYASVSTLGRVAAAHNDHIRFYSLFSHPLQSYCGQIFLATLPPGHLYHDLVKLRSGDDETPLLCQGVESAPRRNTDTARRPY